MNWSCTRCTGGSIPSRIGATYPFVARRTPSEVSHKTTSSPRSSAAPAVRYATTTESGLSLPLPQPTTTLVTSVLLSWVLERLPAPATTPPLRPRRRPPRSARGAARRCALLDVRAQDLDVNGRFGTHAGTSSPRRASN